MSEKSKRELELIIQRLNSQLESKNAQIAELNEFIKTATENTQELIRKFRAFCVKVLESELAYGAISSRDLETMSLSELLERAGNMLQQNQENARSIYETFKIRLGIKNGKIQSLEKRLAYLKTQIDQKPDNSNSQFQTPDDMKRVPVMMKDTDTPCEALKPAVAVTTIADENERIVDVEGGEIIGDASGISEGKLYVQDMEKLEGQMKPLHWEIFNLIVSEGISEVGQAKNIIRQRLKDGNENISLEKAGRHIKELVTLMLFAQVRVNTGIRWFAVLNLTHLGREIYISKYKKDPIETEYQKVVREHENADHGYTIRDVVQILRDTGKYRSISMSRKRNAVKLETGKTCIPDIVCCTNEEVEYYEVECGNHHQSDFNEKCDKLSSVTPNLFFIAPNRETVEKKLKPQIEAWIKASDRQVLLMSGVVVYLTSISDLAAQRWTYVYNMQSDKPIYTSASADKKP